MENPQTLSINNTTTFVEEMDQIIPKHLQLPVGIAVS